MPLVPTANRVRTTKKATECLDETVPRRVSLLKRRSLLHALVAFGDLRGGHLHGGLT
jgi:hypothetical protein